MRRKVVKHGTATLTVSLPSKWVKQYNIKPGEELEVVPTGKDLLISTHQEPTAKRAELNLTQEKTRTIEKILKNFYRMGYDEIKINFEKNETLLKVKQVLNLYLGLEVVEESSKSCLIRNVSPTITLDFNTVFRKCFLLILQEYEFIFSNLENGALEPPEIIEQMNHDLRKFTVLCQRMLFQSSTLPSELQASYYTILSKLLRTSWNCRDIFKIICTQKKEISKDTIAYLKMAQQLFADSYEAIFKRDSTKIEELDGKKMKLYGVFYQRIQRKSGAENLLFYHIYNNIRLTCVFSPLPIMASADKETGLEKK